LFSFPLNIGYIVLSSHADVTTPFAMKAVLK